MAINPSRTLRIASELYPLLEVMAAGEYSVSRSMILSEIRSFIELKLPKEERDAKGIVEAMEQNGLLEVEHLSAHSPNQKFCIMPEISNIKTG